MCCIYFWLMIGLVVPILSYIAYIFVTEDRKRRTLERWNNTPKDVIILHGYPRGRKILSPSPYPLKVETYLRLANLKYELDTTDIWGPQKGKTPWISINGKHVADSEFIFDFLNKKFEKDLNSSCDGKDVANAMIIRVMLEEYLAWAFALERMVYGSIERVRAVCGDKVPSYILYWFRRVTRKRAFDQGIGRHSQEEVTHLMTKYLKSVSVALGSKKYFGGDSLCQEDCGIFGILAQCLWGLPDTPYEALLNEECRNLKDYCVRIKEKAFPDWDELLSKD